MPDEPADNAAAVGAIARRCPDRCRAVDRRHRPEQSRQTFETVSSLITKPLPGYGELFRMLSYQEIGPAAMLSRAVGGLMASTVVLTMPGSPAAVRLAVERIIVPELRHLVREARR